MFWQRFTELCSSCGKFPNNVASDLGLSNATTTGWKQGALPRAATLKKVADYFGVSVEYLKGETDIKNPGAKESTEMNKEVVRLFNKVPEEKKEEAMRYLRFLAESHEP